MIVRLRILRFILRRAALFGSVATSAIALAGPAWAAAACSGPIRIGLTTPMTGELVSLGIQARDGVLFAVDEFNAGSGIAGQKIALTMEDETSSSTTAVNVLNRVLEQRPLIVFGSMISPHVFAQVKTIDAAKVPFLIAGTNAAITAQGSPWLFRISVHDGQLADLAPRYLVEQMGKKRPGIIAVGDDYGLGASKGLQATLATLNARAVAAESYAPTDMDMSAQLLRIRDKGADSLMIWGRPGDVTIIMKQVKQLGIDLPEIGNASVVAQTTLNNLAPSEANGAIAIGGMIPQGSTDPKVIDWMKRVQDKFKVPADNFTVSYYDAMHMLKDIVEQVGCDRAAIRDALAKLNRRKGMFITYTADQRGDLAHTLGVYQNQGKTPRLIGTLNEHGF